MDATKLLQAIWGKQNGYVFLPTKKGKAWHENGYKYPEEFDKVCKHVESEDAVDKYWCPMVFTEPQRKKEYALQPSVLWADLDLVNPTTLGELEPTIAWKSSEDRYQCLWAIVEDKEGYDFEGVNKSLTYKIGADKSGWDYTQVLRIPGSMNYKYDPPQRGKFLWARKKYFNISEVSKTCGMSTTSTSPMPDETIDALVDGYDIPERTAELLACTEDEVVKGERSDRLWEIETSLLEVGVPVADVIKIIKLCAWNKFKDRRDEDKQIYTEVLKAEKHVRETHISSVTLVDSTPPVDIKEEPDLIKSFDEFMEAHIDPPEWLVRDIWQLNTYGMIAGEPKTYKSVQSMDLCLSVASGVPFLNYFETMKTGAVLYIQEENGENTVQDRARKIATSKNVLSGGGTMANVPLYFVNNIGLNFKTTHSRQTVEQLVGTIRPRLVVLDPLYMMFGDVDENSAKEVGDILRWLTSLRNKYECGLLICHHYNKGAQNGRGGKRIRGTGAFHAWIESALYIQDTTEQHKVKVEREFRSFPSIGYIDVEIELGEPGQMIYSPKVTETHKEGGSMTLKKEEIVDILSSSPRTEEELKELTSSTRTEIKRSLKELMDDGFVTKAGGGGRGRVTKYMLEE